MKLQRKPVSFLDQKFSGQKFLSKRQQAGPRLTQFCFATNFGWRYTQEKIYRFLSFNVPLSGSAQVLPRYVLHNGGLQCRNAGTMDASVFLRTKTNTQIKFSSFALFASFQFSFCSLFVCSIFLTFCVCLSFCFNTCDRRAISLSRISRQFLFSGTVFPTTSRRHSTREIVTSRSKRVAPVASKEHLKRKNKHKTQTVSFS